jgi:DNA-binding Xre family transcriptional regulator
MIKCKFEALRKNKERVEGRRLSLRTIAEEVRVSTNTVQRMRQSDIDRVYISTLDKFCKYFDLHDINELIEFVPSSAEV